MKVQQRYISSVSALAFMFLFTPSVYSSTAENNASGKGVFDGDLFTSLFTLALFLLVFMVLAKYAWNPLLRALKSREDSIKRSLDDADKARVEAERSLKTLESRLKLADEEAHRILEESQQAARQAADKIVREAQAHSDDIRRLTRQEIDRARENAIKDIYHQISLLSTQLAGQIINKNLNPGDHQALIQDSIDQYRNQAKKY